MSRVEKQLIDSKRDPEASITVTSALILLKYRLSEEQANAIGLADARPIKVEDPIGVARRYVRNVSKSRA